MHFTQACQVLVKTNVDSAIRKDKPRWSKADSSHFKVNLELKMTDRKPDYTILSCRFHWTNTTNETQVKARHWPDIDTFECFVRHVEVVTVVVTDRALLTSAFWEAEEDEMVVLVEEEEEGEGGKVVDCCGGRGGKVEAVVVLGEGRCGGLPRCELSCFAADPPPFCAGLCLTTFSSSIWVSAVPWARPKSTSAYL